MKKIKSPEEIVEFLKERYKDKIKSFELKERVQGVSGTKVRDLWITVERDIFKDLVKTLHEEVDFLHVSVISSVDMGEMIEVIYHFCVYYGKPSSECVINIKVELPKDDLKIPTITDIIPGALFSELDNQEMMGIEFVGVPEEGPLFLPDEFPSDFYPWRKDDKSIDNYIAKDFTIDSEGNKDGDI